MAFFGVTVETVEKSEKHPNADRLDITTLKGIGFSFVTRRDEFKSGDEIVYFPIDSLLPKSITDLMGLTGKLSGKEKNRIKTAKLRGVLSQGIVLPIQTVTDSTNSLEVDEIRSASKYIIDQDGGSSNQLTEFLGIKKYEPEAVPCKAGNLLPLPHGLGVYDIEGCERYITQVEKLMDQKVYITEKLEGQNFSVHFNIEDNKFYVNQRKFTIEPIEGTTHDFWKVVNNLNLRELCETRAKLINKSVTVYGEFIGPGVQGNKYKLTDHTIRVFDIKDDREWLSPIQFAAVAGQFNLATVPILACGVTLREWLDGKTIVQASNGMSILNKNQLREGIVIKPMTEQWDEEIGRLILKQRDPIYLAECDE